MQHATRWSWIAALGLSACAGRLDSPEPSEESSPRCIPGQSAACACTNGLVGAQVCNESGAFAACICESGVLADSSAGPDSVTTDAVAEATPDATVDTETDAALDSTEPLDTFVPDDTFVPVDTFVADDGFVLDDSSIVAHGDAFADARFDDAPAVDSSIADAPTDSTSGGGITVDAGVCAPLTCATILGHCGVVADGCGGALSCGTCATTTTVTFALGAHDLAFDRTRGLLYVATPATDRYVALRAGDGVQRYEFPAGPQASTLALSSDDSTLYVGLQGSYSVRKVKLPTLSSDLTFTVGSSPYYGSYWAGQMAVVPGSANTVVISRLRAVSPDIAGVAVFDDGVMRPDTTPEHSGARLIAIADATTVYAYNNATTEYGTRRLRIKPTGIVEEFLATGLISGWYLDFVYEGGRLFTTMGTTVDTTSMLNVGPYPANGAVASESSTNRVYYLATDSGNRVLIAFDRTTFTEVARVSLGPSAGTPRQMIRWGSQGLAYLEYPDTYSTTARLVLINSSLVLPPP